MCRECPRIQFPTTNPGGPQPERFSRILLNHGGPKIWVRRNRTVVVVVGEYGGKEGKDSGVGNGCGKGASNVAFAFAGPAFNRNKENGAPSKNFDKRLGRWVGNNTVPYPPLSTIRLGTGQELPSKPDSGSDRVLPCAVVPEGIIRAQNARRKCPESWRPQHNLPGSRLAEGLDSALPMSKLAFCPAGPQIGRDARSASQYSGSATCGFYSHPARNPVPSHTLNSRIVRPKSSNEAKTLLKSGAVAACATGQAENRASSETAKMIQVPRDRGCPATW